MKRKKFTSLTIICVIALTLLTGTTIAFAYDNAKANRESALAQAPEMTQREALEEMANVTGIETAGMDIEEINNALLEKKQISEARQIANPIPNLADDNDMEAFLAELMALNEAYMDRTSDEDLNEYRAARVALEEKYPLAARESLLEMAAYVGIDVTGMTDEEINEALGADKKARGH
jgi:hypothetical protein